jgi:hypothetical protein
MLERSLATKEAGEWMVFYEFIFLLSLRFHSIPFKIQASTARADC